MSLINFRQIDRQIKWSYPVHGMKSKIDDPST